MRSRPYLISINLNLTIMKQIDTILTLLGSVVVLFGCSTKPDKVTSINATYVIEREIPGAGKLTADELKASSQNSSEVLRKLGPEIKWLHSYVTQDKVYCVYSAPNKDLIIEHARLAGVPANSISEVSSIVEPDSFD